MHSWVVEPVPLADVLEQTLTVSILVPNRVARATEILLSLLPEKVKLPKTGEDNSFVINGRELALTRLPSTSGSIR